MCLGPCEGMGCVPVPPPGRVWFESGDNQYRDELRRRWKAEEHANGPSKDGWHNVTCPACEGSRLRPLPIKIDQAD